MSESDAAKVEFSMKVMLNEEKTKVLFAEADSDFTDILLSFLTLPMGRILKVLEKHYGDEAPTIGSLTTLYHSLANLDSSHFWTEGAKEALLDPISTFDADCERLKLDITDSPPAEYFYCYYLRSSHNRFRSVSMYYDNVKTCKSCGCGTIRKEVAKRGSEAASTDGVFTMHTASFIVSDDLLILPSETGLLGVLETLCITDTDKAEPIKVTFGLSEIMNLLKASLISQTPLSDLILNKTRRANSVTVESEAQASLNRIEDDPNSKKMILKLMIQTSTGKLLYAQAKEDFVELLFSLLCIPLGGVEHLLAGKICVKAINNLYRSTTECIDGEYFKSPDMKNRLMKPNVAHGYVSKNHILPLTEEPLPAADYSDLWRFSTVKFPKGQGSYIKGPRTYHVTDDLTVTPFCIVSILSTLNKAKIPVSDVEEVELQIGLKEGLSILNASLTSTSALTDALLKQPKLGF